MNKPLATVYAVAALASPFVARVFRQPQKYPRARLVMLTIIDWLVLRPFFQRFVLLMCLSVPIVSWLLRPVLTDGWLIEDVGFILFLSAMFGLMLSLEGWRFGIRSLAKTCQAMLNKPR